MSSHRRETIAATLLLGLAASLPFPAVPQTFPENRPITLVVPFAPGGGTDALARDLGRLLNERLGQPVAIDNRGGGGGAIGAELVARARPDGHTLLFATSTLVTSASTGQKQPYDIIRDFTPIAWLGQGPMLLVVNKDLGVASVAELVALARAKPDALNFVSSGLGSITHLAGELFVQRTGIKMTHVPYRGSGPAVIDLLSGQGQVFFATVPTILGQVRAGAVKVIAATGKTRTRLFPDVPTVAEAGVPDYAVGTWWGIVGPAGLSPGLTAQLNKAVNEAAASDSLRKRFSDEGAEPFAGTPEAFGALLRDELETWRRVVKDGNLKIE
jgi:tripartite-type tricarboxylate transporter receptor subunit TctC